MGASACMVPTGPEPLYSTFDIVVQASSREACQTRCSKRRLPDARLWRRPPGIRRIVLDGQTGLLVPVEDPVALVRALDRLVSDADLRSD